ncbi:helix-turn-helix domain-containing protein [Lentibacillus sp. CBA3610]|uniref:helix-turn-helix domain-containing protein n=1 Tax=Lentibacillus sp. CBA3610 TaxID=2518176 RepID=UPI001595F804|nr:helix-turn-helix domain-containing protein [Lentibacillus sp. CBA3610]QKY69225.1 hypothetical protein Len3610_06035 [Lentibacillus sp. CBA3610]
MLLDYIIISCCSKFREGRSISAVYHLLKGKRSIQTVQDSHIYDLKHFYGIYQTLHKQDFDEYIQKLFKHNLLVLKGDNVVLPTDRGMNWINEPAENVPVRYFNGMEYNRKAPVFWERLLLSVQTMTNSRSNSFNFIPVIDKPDVMAWVKSYYRQWRNHQTAFLSQLYSELSQLLQLFWEKEASLFVDSLTGYKHYGMSSFQLAEHYGLRQIDIPLIRTAIIHRMLAIITQDTAAYPLFAQFLRDLPEEAKLTNSANKTKKFLERNYSAEDIAAIRHLKLNTIYDHMVEIALYDESFPLGQYVTSTEQEEIRTAINSTKSYKLKEIKHEISETISYFQIRLVLATEKTHQGDYFVKR